MSGVLSEGGHGPGRRAPSSPARKRLIGLLVLAALAGAVALIYFKPSFSSGQTVRVAFSTAQGLGVVGREVEVAGTPVGSITGVARQGSHAILTLSIDSGIVVRTDATAQLRPHLPFEGTAYVDLQPGSPPSPLLRGAVLGLARTSVYVPVFHALSLLTPAIRGDTRADAGDLAQTLHGTGVGGLQGTLRGAPALTATLAPAAAAAQGSHGTELAGAVAGLARTVAGFDEHQSRLEPLIGQAADTLAALGTRSSAPLSQTLAQLPGTLSALYSGSRALDGIVVRLRPLARELSPGLAVLAGSLQRTEPLLLAAAPTLRSAPPLLEHLRVALSDGAGATPVADRLLGTLAPSVSLLRASLLPALLGPSASLKIPAYLSFISLFEGGGGASAPFETPAQAKLPGQTGVGHFMRFGARFFTGIGYPLPPCTLVEKLSAQLAATFAADGVCQS